MERLVEMGEGILLRLQPWVAGDADRTRDVGPLDQMFMREGDGDNPVGPSARSAARMAA